MPSPAPPSRSSESKERSPRDIRARVFVVAVWAGIPLLYLAIRALVLSAHFDCLDVEELHYGLLPSQLFDPLLPLFSYQILPREGGSLLIAPVYAIAQAIVGDSYLGLKCGGLLWHGLTLMVWMALLWRHVSRYSAVAFGLLYAVAPPFLARMQINALGTHTEALLPLGICLALLLVALDADRPRRRRFAAGCFGLAAGLTLYFTFSTALFVALAMAALLRNGRSGLVALPGLVLGFSPWLVNLAIRGDAADIWASSGASPLAFLLNETPDAPIFSDEGLLARAGAFFGGYQFQKWGFRGPVLKYDSPMNWVYSAFVAAIVVTGVWRMRRSVYAVLRSAGRWTGLHPEAWLVCFLGLYAIMFPAIVVLSKIDIDPSVFDGFRYQISGLLVVLVLAALSAKAAGWRVALPAGACLLALAVWGAMDLRDPRYCPTPLGQYCGYNLLHVEPYIHRLPAEDRLRAIETRRQIRLELIQLHGFGSAREFDVATLTKEATKLPEAWRPYFWEGACRGFLLDDEFLEGDLVDAGSGVARFAHKELLAEDRSGCLVGIGRALVHHSGPRDHGSAATLLTQLAEQDPVVVTGFGIEDLRTGTLQSALRLTDTLIEAEMKTDCSGLGRQLARQAWPPWSPPEQVDISYRLRALIEDLDCGEEPLWAGYRSELQAIESSGLYR